MNSIKKKNNKFREKKKKNHWQRSLVKSSQLNVTFVTQNTLKVEFLWLAWFLVLKLCERLRSTGGHEQAWVLFHVAIG